MGTVHNFWVKQYSVKDTGEECEVDKKSAWNNYVSVISGGLFNRAPADFYHIRGTRICGSGGRVSFSPQTQGIFCMSVYILYYF